MIPIAFFTDFRNEPSDKLTLIFLYEIYHFIRLLLLKLIANMLPFL